MRTDPDHRPLARRDRLPAQRRPARRHRARSLRPHPATAATTDQEAYHFTTPAGDIFCDTRPDFIQCGVDDPTFKTPPDPDPDRPFGDWVPSVITLAEGDAAQAGAVLSGPLESARQRADRTATVLGYGQAVANGGGTACLAQQIGVSC
ncbi:MAG: hypothetical protein LBU05_00945 [Bifidobacteriaceae bacterium]|nr:hypothetical protein [Bifidobacteriaceae bacterium]